MDKYERGLRELHKDTWELLDKLEVSLLESRDLAKQLAEKNKELKKEILMLNVRGVRPEVSDE